MLRSLWTAASGMQAQTLNIDVLSNNLANLNTPEWSYKWVYEQWRKDNYKAVQDRFDQPYNRLPAPSKIPAGALEFDISLLGEIDTIRLIIKDAVCEIRWKNGARLQLKSGPSFPKRKDRWCQTGVTPQLLNPGWPAPGRVTVYPRRHPVGLQPQRRQPIRPSWPSGQT